MAIALAFGMNAIGHELVEKLVIGKKAAELALLGLRGGARSSGAHHILSVQLLERSSVAKKGSSQ